MIMTKTDRLPRWPFVFDVDKAVEAILFIAPSVKNPTLHSVSKVLYQADRIHLARFGRPITGDRYVAMKHGPVPSGTYDVLKTLRGDAHMQLPPGIEQAIAVQNAYSVVPMRAPDLAVLSQSEQQCLRESVDAHGSKTFQHLTNESHDAAWDAAGENDIIELEHFLLTLDNGDELRAHFLHPDS